MHTFTHKEQKRGGEKRSKIEEMKRKMKEEKRQKRRKGEEEEERGLMRQDGRIAHERKGKKVSGNGRELSVAKIWQKSLDLFYFDGAPNNVY